MSAKRVTVASKPEHVDALRSTWRSSAEHGAEQLKRFLRLFLLAALVPVVDLVVSKNFHYETLVAVVVPIAETLFRQQYPALGAAAADAAPGVTIVPDEVEGDGP